MIPPEAMEAAHRAWREQAALEGSIFEYNLRAALEAAAPHIRDPGIECCARAWDMGMSVGEQYGAVTERAYEWGTSQEVDPPANPFRSADV